MINYKIELSLTWGEKSLSGEENIYDAWNVANAGTAATFKKTDAKFFLLVVTLLTEDNVKLSEQLNDGFKRFVYWNKYKIIPNKTKIFLIVMVIKENNNVKENCMILIIKELKYYLFLLMIILIKILKLKLIFMKNVFLQE